MQRVAWWVSIFILVAWGTVTILDRNMVGLLAWGCFVAALLALAVWDRRRVAHGKDHT